MGCDGSQHPEEQDGDSWQIPQAITPIHRIVPPAGRGSDARAWQGLPKWRPPQLRKTRFRRGEHACARKTALTPPESPASPTPIAHYNADSKTDRNPAPFPRGISSLDHKALDATCHLELVTSLPSAAGAEEGPRAAPP